MNAPICELRSISTVLVVPSRRSCRLRSVMFSPHLPGARQAWMAGRRRPAPPGGAVGCGPAQTADSAKAAASGAASVLGLGSVRPEGSLDRRTRELGDAALHPEGVAQREPRPADVLGGVRIVVLDQVADESAGYSELSVAVQMRVLAVIDLRNEGLEPLLV